MARLISIFALPLLLIGLVAYFLPDGPKTVKKAIAEVTRVITNQPAPNDEPPAPAPSAFEQLAVPTVTVGPEHANKPELRIWAIRNDRNYGWIQLPRGTTVWYLRQDGDYYIVRYEETIIRAHRDVVDTGMIVVKKARYAVAY
jgi:hypothetical protein